MEVLMINLHKHEYKNKDAANNLIRYITRTRPNEDRAHELLSYGFPFGNAYQKPLEFIIKEYEFIQKYYSAKGTLMCHYSMHISNYVYKRMNNDLFRLNQYAQECCNYIFHLGHQACYAIHYSKTERLHIHFAINAVNYKNGSKLRQYPAEIKKNIEYPLNQILPQYYYTPKYIITDLE